MQDLVKQANIYISSKKDKKESPNHQVLEGIAKYLTHMLKVFGAIDEEQVIGFPVAGKNATANVRYHSLDSVLYFQELTANACFVLEPYPCIGKETGLE